MCNDKDTLIAFVYGELPAPAQRAFEAHVMSCEPCRSEVAGLRAVRDDLLAWAPPECRDLPSSWAEPVQAATPADRLRAWMPAFGLAAAAMLVVAVSAAIANVEVRYGSDGLVVRTGRSAGQISTAAASRPDVVLDAAAPASITAEDLAHLEARLRRTFEAAAEPSAPRVALSSTNPQLTREVRRLIEESEQRVRQDMAARLLDVYNEWDAARRTDMMRVQQVLGQVQSRTGADLAQQQNMINRLMLVSQGQQQPPR